MTLRDVLDLFDLDEEDGPVQAMFGVTMVLRTWNQMERSTFEGDWAGLLNVCKLLGPPTKESVLKFKADCPNLLDQDIPEPALRAFMAGIDG